MKFILKNTFWVIKLKQSRVFLVVVLWTPYFGSMRLPLDGELDFYLLENDLESLLIFVLFFKRVNKIRKKNPKCDSLFGKGGLRKTGSSSRVRLLIGKVR